MKRTISLLFSCLFVSISVSAQLWQADTLSQRIWNQVVRFPQEKLYLHLDKSVYFMGEKIWMRAYVVNALSHQPERASRYVYAELINPFNQVVDRVRLRQDEHGYIHGCLVLDERSMDTLDLLMMTQGWRRYNLSEVVLGKIQTFFSSV